MRTDLSNNLIFNAEIYKLMVKFSLHRAHSENTDREHHPSALNLASLFRRTFLWIFDGLFGLGEVERWTSIVDTGYLLRDRV